MCTVSWTAGHGGYDLFFNRDELDTRAPETPPAAALRDGATFVAPRDGDHGGTWLLANEYGLTVCLLNDYACPWRPPAAANRHSRGHLVLACAAASGHADVIDILGRQPLARTPAFHLAAFSADEGPLVLHWNGTQLRPHARAAGGPPLSSSSYETAGVIAARTARFAEVVRSPHAPTLAELAAYHRQHDPKRGAFSVLMRRPDAATRSITHVSVRADAVSLSYEPVRWTPQGAVAVVPTDTTLPRRRRA